MTFISRLIGVALAFGVAGHVQAVESLPVRDSADFNYQLNGDVAPPAISGSVVWSADGDILTFNRNLGAGNFGWNNVLNHGLGYTFEMRFRITEPESSGLGVSESSSLTRVAPGHITLTASVRQICLRKAEWLVSRCSLVLTSRTDFTSCGSWKSQG